MTESVEDVGKGVSIVQVQACHQIATPASATYVSVYLRALVSCPSHQSHKHPSLGSVQASSYRRAHAGSIVPVKSRYCTLHPQHAEDVHVSGLGGAL
jgi:hypothetical protein